MTKQTSSKKVKPQSTKFKPLLVENIPGKKTNELPPRERVTGKCAVCKIIFESKADTTFRKGKVKQTTWVGCEHRGCKYWGHAVCVGLGIKPKVVVGNIPFKCFKHRKR